MAETIVVYDSDHPGAKDNVCFTDSYAAQGPGHSFTVDLARELNSRGIRTVTADVFLKDFDNLSANATVLAITDMVSRNTGTLLKRGSIPFICMCTESPLIARSFYMNIRKLAGRFIYNIQFRGTEDRLKDTGTLFSPMYYPSDNRAQTSVTWSERKLLILINRNKRAFFHNTSSLKNTVRSVLSRVNVVIQRTRDPWLRSKELYKERIESISYFSNNPGFDLYGQGWERPIPGFNATYHKAAVKAFRGPLGPTDKVRTMSRYKFAICFENCVFPGYVTEKIFDCFLAGCIPLYYGAPDIEDFVPKGSFIDVRQFSSFEELEKHIQLLTEEEGMKIVNEAKRFLDSKSFDRYDQAMIIKKIVDRVLIYPKTDPLN